MVLCLVFGDRNALLAQTALDSLLQERLTATHDTLKIRIDLEAGRTLRGSSLDSSLYYLDRALTLAQENLEDFPQFEAYALIGKAEAYRVNGNELSFEYYEKGLEVLEKLDLKKELSFEQYEYAKYNSNMSRFKEAVAQYQQLIERNLKDGTAYRLGRAYNNAGLNYYYLHYLDKASEMYLNAIKQIQQSDDTTILRAPYLNYGLVLTEQEQFELAKDYIKKSIVIETALDNKFAMARGYSSLGVILISQDSLDAAVESVTRSWEISQPASRNTWPSARYYNTLSEIELLRGNYQKAHEHILQSVNNLPPRAAYQSKADIFGRLVRLNLILADSVYATNRGRQRELWKQALPYAVEGWALAEKSTAGDVKYRLANAQAVLYSKLGEFQKAFRFSQVAKEISDDINDQARTDAIARMSAEFETERIESQNTLLRETQKAQTAQLKQQNFVIFGAIVGLVLIGVIAVVIYRSRFRLKKASQEIEQSLSEKELLLKEIHHRVKNNLQVISSLLELQSFGIEDEKALSTFMEGQNRVKAMALIHQKLYQNENLATIDFGEYAEQLSQDLAGIYPNAGKVTTSVNAGSKVKFDIDTAVPLGLILNELISNSYKYAFEDKEAGELQVSIESIGDGKHQLMVEDNGRGLSKGFDLEKAKSLGLRLVNRLAEQLYGTVEYYGDHGAKFVINFEESIRRNPS